VELRLIRPDGDRVGEMRVTEFEWFGERAFLAAIRDVTNQRNMEMQLLTSDRLVSLGTLAAGVAHEINNPLAAVLANVDLALRDAAALSEPSPVHPELMSELRDARDAAERIRHIVRDLKVFSRTEEDARTAVDVRRILDSVARMAGNEIRHRARLVKEYREVPAVMANESRLSQVFLNLLVNAAQAIPEGKAEDNEIRIVTRRGAEGRVCIDIKDTGCGIPEAARARLFTPFFTTKPVGSGTGIGLAICQRIVRAFGGELSFESRVGEGTCFTVGLPGAETEAEAEERPGPPPSAPQLRRRGRVLVVDDDPMIIQSIRRVLSGQHELVCHDRAESALGLLRAGQRFDVILCDLMMPEVTGMEFCGRLVELDPVQAERVVLMTGGAFTTQAREFLDASPYQRVEKPFDVPGLRALINSLMV
jgi:signal transduction histidine kinase